VTYASQPEQPRYRHQNVGKACSYNASFGHLMNFHAPFGRNNRRTHRPVRAANVSVFPYLVWP
jgi:hypothetical protein